MEECKCKPAKSYAERIIEYQEFVSLVKRMREAQVEHKIADMQLKYHQAKGRAIPDDVWNSFACTMDWMIYCEDAVDEYLDKLEEKK